MVKHTRLYSKFKFLIIWKLKRHAIEIKQNDPDLGPVNWVTPCSTTWRHANVVSQCGRWSIVF
ncbi:hypothetical protein SLEP1_g8721 [Rubroshorea leprosula]|uniref:Uncharacterized protein n=1 Tax=Rubroshorea leprosula TaxID=152421 RepID=A0AAV5IDJ2_9ROSI|nr:hypothetical protein SLEP1_g8721 [Rubroshorea leprosula]